MVKNLPGLETWVDKTCSVVLSDLVVLSDSVLSDTTVL